jgi:hypothetical protein
MRSSSAPEKKNQIHSGEFTKTGMSLCSSFLRVYGIQE